MALSLFLTIPLLFLVSDSTSLLIFHRTILSVHHGTINSHRHRLDALNFKPTGLGQSGTIHYYHHPQRLDDTALRAQSSKTTTTTTPLDFTDTVFDEIAVQVQTQVDIPFAPAPIVTYCMKQVLERMAHDLAPETLNRVHEIMVAEETPSQYDDLSQPEIQELADQVSQELSTKSVVHLPMLTREQEQTILQQIIRVIFQVLTTSEEERRTAWISSNLGNASWDLLTCPERRRDLARTINQMVDIPLLGEDQEEAILLAAVEQCAHILQELVPQDLLQTLKGESPEGLSEMKDYMIQVVNAKVDLIGFNEEQEAELIRTMIDILIDAYANDTDAGLLLSSPSEKQEHLQQKLAEVEWEITASEARFRREQDSLQAHRERLQAMLDDI